MYVDVDTLLQRGFFLWDCGLLGGAGVKKNPTFMCVGIRKILQQGSLQNATKHLHTIHVVP
jgi:hypothetical protein